MLILEKAYKDCFSEVYPEVDGLSELPRAAIERLIRKAGAPRVSVSAVDAMTEILEDVAADIATNSIRLAKHAGRKTVTKADIHMAAKS